MNTYNFSIQQHPIYGTFGEFAVGLGPTQVKAKYLLTKIRPGNQGSWENHLASKMSPWREIFQVEELSFDELIQRDLDDSRVAHDMIPYLLGETGHHARFFPPVLAVLVPKKVQGSGIAARYPKSSVQGEKEAFEDLFEFEQVMIGSQKSPLGVIKYNAQKTAMVIVDGQHRAMAVLALHRQLNKSWQSDPFAPYYNHLEVNPEAVEHIELPVCVIYFPDIHEENETLKEAGIDLVTVCREIFTVVNKSAKPVGKSRELLLNDEDFAAFMMRRTLTKLKGRQSSEPGAARIYSFAFGDEDNIGSGQVLSGKIEYSSAVAIHKMHGAVGFSMPAAFGLLNSCDITDGRFVRNSTRPVDLLSGNVPVANLKTISKRGAKAHKPAISDAIVSGIGDLTDSVILPLFDELRPYVAHNEAMRELLEALNDPAARADLIQSKCKSLIFDGSGARTVFDEHTDRLKKRKEELSDAGSLIPPHLDQQITYCDSVARALETHEDNLKISRAFKLFNIDANGFRNRDKSIVEQETKVVRGIARTIFDTLATQAFQIGYLMAVLTALEKMCPAGATYEQRAKSAKFLSKLYLNGLNSLFFTNSVKHKSSAGYVTEPRARVFDGSADGFRGLLQAGNVRELNEKQWEFFRFLVLEVVHSKRAHDKSKPVLDDQEWSEQQALYRAILPQLLTELDGLRGKYFEAAIRVATNSPDFDRQRVQAEADAKAAGKDDADIRKILEDMFTSKSKEVVAACQRHLSASLGKLEKRSDQLNRFLTTDANTQQESIENTITDVEASDGQSAVAEVLVETAHELKVGDDSDPSPLGDSPK
jgi:hypothetical protein